MKTSAWLLGATLTVAAAPALANGRFPDAQQLVESPVDPDHVVIQATFGLVVSRDGGASWGWVCERATGYVGELDPPVAVSSTGATFAGLFDGLSTSDDDCDWSFVGEPIGDRFVVDVSARRSDPSDVVVLTTNGLGATTFESRFFRSADGGRTFTEPGAPLPESFIGETLDVAPSDPDRVYLTGFRVLAGNEFEGVLARSDDGGRTFTIVPVEGSDASAGPFLAAVDPNDADVLYVRLTGPGGRLLRSEDGGSSFDAIAAVEGLMHGFALSPDGASIAIGGVTDELRIGPATGEAFEVVSTVKPRCLTWTERGLYACGSETGEGFTLGLSTDGGRTFEELFSRLCLSGPLACPAGSMVSELCPIDWPFTRVAIGADLCGSTTAGAGGSDGASSGSPAAATSTGAGGGEEPASAASDGGCCAIAPGSPPHDRRALVVGIVSAAVLGARVAQRRRRGGSRTSHHVGSSGSS